jgi:hypothetical protein
MAVQSATPLLLHYDITDEPNQPTTRNRVLEKLTVTQLVKKFPALYGTRRFITVFTTAGHWSLSWARWIQCTPTHPASRGSILQTHGYINYPNEWPQSNSRNGVQRLQLVFGRYSVRVSVRLLLVIPHTIQANYDRHWATVQYGWHPHNPSPYDPF